MSKTLIIDLEQFQKLTKIYKNVTLHYENIEINDHLYVTLNHFYDVMEEISRENNYPIELANRETSPTNKDEWDTSTRKNYWRALR